VTESYERAPSGQATLSSQIVMLTLMLSGSLLGDKDIDLTQR